MFTLHVSWLLVACVPALLMLAALGLGRLESSLTHRPVVKTNMRTLALDARHHSDMLVTAEFVDLSWEIYGRAPSRAREHVVVTPQFRTTRHVNHL